MSAASDTCKDVLKNFIGHLTPEQIYILFMMMIETLLHKAQDFRISNLNVATIEDMF